MRKATFRTQAQLLHHGDYDSLHHRRLEIWDLSWAGGPSTCYSESYAYLVCLMDTSRRQRPLGNVTVLFLLITRLGTGHLIDGRANMSRPRPCTLETVPYILGGDTNYYHTEREVGNMLLVPLEIWLQYKTFYRRLLPDRRTIASLLILLCQKVRMEASPSNAFMLIHRPLRV
jgi:hypothetical protein